MLSMYINIKMNYKMLNLLMKQAKALKALVLLSLFYFICACSMSNNNNIDSDFYHTKFPETYKYKETIINNFWMLTEKQDDYFLSSFPNSSIGYIQDRKLHYIMINKNKKTNIISVSIVGGKPFNPNEPAVLEVNNHKYYFSLYNNTEWLVDQTQINQLFRDFTKSSTFTVINQFKDGKKAVDTYSLKGFTKLYNKIK